VPTAPGYADVSIELVHGSMSRPAFITFGVDPVDTDPVLVAASVISAIGGSGTLQGMLDTTLTIRSVRVSLGVDGAEDLKAVTAISLPGLKTGSMLPPNSALLLHKRTARGGRRGRGRMYLPWSIQVTETDEAGVIAAATVTAQQAKATAFLSALGSNTVPMVVLHEPGQTATGPPNPVTSLLVDARVGTQRRRLGR